MSTFEAYMAEHMTYLYASLSVLYTILNIVTPIINIVYFTAFIILTSALFGKYAPKQRLLFTLLSVIVPIAFNFILIFGIMEKKPYATYDEYYKEQMAKRFGQAYNPYENPYNTRENPFSENNKKQDSPFDDYKDNNSNDNGNSNLNGGNSDGNGGSPFDEF